MCKVPGCQGRGQRRMPACLIGLWLCHGMHTLPLRGDDPDPELLQRPGSGHSTPECRSGSRFDKSQTEPLRRHNGTLRYQRGGRMRRNKSRTRSGSSPLSVGLPSCQGALASALYLSFPRLRADTVSELGGLALRQPGTADGTLLAAGACLQRGAPRGEAILERSCHDAAAARCAHTGTPRAAPPGRAMASHRLSSSRHTSGRRVTAGSRLSCFLGLEWATRATGMRRKDG